MVVLLHLAEIPVDYPIALVNSLRWSKLVRKHGVGGTVELPNAKPSPE